MTEADLLRDLRDCYDPTLPCNIVDLGLIDHVTLTPAPDAPGSTMPGVPPRYRVAIALIPSTHDENATAQLAAQIQNRLAGLEVVLESTVTFLDEPAWSPQRITSDGRKLLGLDGNPNLIQIGAGQPK